MKEVARVIVKAHCVRTSMAKGHWSGDLLAGRRPKIVLGFVRRSALVGDLRGFTALTNAKLAVFHASWSCFLGEFVNFRHPKISLIISSK